MMKLQQLLWGEVLKERVRQDIKWGANRRLDTGTWLKILVEEVGEVAKADLEGNRQEMLKELVQVVASSLAWLESMHLPSLCRCGHSFDQHPFSGDGQGGWGPEGCLGDGCECKVPVYEIA